MSWRLPPERQVGQPAPESLTARRAGAAAAMADQPVAPGVTVGDEVVGGVATVVCQPPSATSTLLYLHGGGYRLGTPRSWVAFASRLAAATASRVVIADYRLAPENPFPAALHDVVAVYDALRHQEGPLVVAGDSAGGGLAVALVAACLLSGHAVPDGLVVMSPWVDLTLTSPTFQTRATTDQLFSHGSAVEAAQAYLQGVDPGDPLASPLFADLGGFPPTLVFAGGAESLLGDGLGLATRLVEAGVSVEAHFPAGMQHVWPTLFPELPESKAAAATIVRFVTATVDAHPDTMANR
jgi:monoterpene epsilon-lactone hydrolase